eukprot:jgi/Chlat1/5092/Chrsp33S05019
MSTVHVSSCIAGLGWAVAVAVAGAAEAEAEEELRPERRPRWVRKDRTALRVESHCVSLSLSFLKPTIALRLLHIVQLMLDEPLKEELDMRVLIALSCYINMRVERYEWLSFSGVGMQAQPVPDHLRRQVETSCRLLSFEKTDRAVLKSTQMFTMFPEFAKYIIGDPLTQAPAVSQPGLD